MKTPLTKEKKAELKASIQDLRMKIEAAKAQLESAASVSNPVPVPTAANATAHCEVNQEGVCVRALELAAQLQAKRSALLADREKCKNEVTALLDAMEKQKQDVERMLSECDKYDKLDAMEAKDGKDDTIGAGDNVEEDECDLVTKL